MRARTATALPLALPLALLAAGLLAGCGPTLYDAKGVPVVTPTCEDPALPIACLGADACVAEDDSHCGSSCNDCLVTPLANATSFCDRSSLDPALHACSYTCDSGFERDPFGPGCRTALCAAPQVQCGTACFTESATQCGPRCLDCSDPSNVIPHNGSPACLGAPGQGVCGFACPAGFLKSNGECVQVAAGPGTVALGATHTCVITTAGGVMCWGANGSGQLGVGDRVNRLTPTDVTLAGGARAKFIAAGVSHTCAVTAVGTVQCWGSNATAQLGQPLATTSSSVPVELPPGYPAVGDVVIAVAAGAGHTCAISLNVSSQNGSAWCWGANDRGQVGANPAATVLATPTLVNLSGSVDQISTQLDHTCVVKGTNGQVSCWGWNRFGQTGQSPNEIAAPGAAVSSLAARVDMPVSISVGGTHTCAIASAGSAGQGLYCWGDRSTRQVGDGLITSTRPSDPSRATFIDPAGTADRLLTGRAHSCATKGADGTVSCAGANLSLQLGMTPPSSSEPVGLPPVSLGPLDALFGGGDHSCALVSGSLECWGANEHGQLGNDSTAESATPVSPRPY